MIELLLIIFIIIIGVALALRKRDASRLAQMEFEVFLKTSVLEKKLADLERRLKIAEGLRTVTEPANIPTPVPDAVVVSQISKPLFVRQKAAPANLAKSKAVRKVQRANRYNQFLLSTLVTKPQVTPVVPVVTTEEKPFVAQLVSPTIPAPKPAAIECFVEKRIAEKAEKTEKVVVSAPMPTPVAYTLDEEDHDLRIYNSKPSSLTKEQAHLDYLELLLGRKVLGWVAAVAMILSAVFLINYTAQRFTMPPIFRVISLFALSLGMIGFGYRYFLIGWKRFSRMLTTTGIIIAFLAGYATYGYYQLLPGTAAFLLLSVVVIGSFLLAYGYRSILIGVHAIIGGLAVPLLVESSGETYPQFFAYLFLLNLGTVLLLNTLNRLPIGLLAMLGTQIEFFFWYLSVGTVHWDGREFLFSLDDQAAVRYAFAFQAAFYLLYLIDTSFGTISTRFRTTWDDTVRAILAPMIGFGWIYVLYHQAPVMGAYMGLFAFIGAAWYALVHQFYVSFTKKRLETL